jgi:hypothetical protein
MKNSKVPYLSPLSMSFSALADTLKVGDKVMTRNFGGPHTVINMELTERPREKYGKEVKKVSWYWVDQNMVIIDLDNGHWSYSENISRV